VMAAMIAKSVSRCRKVHPFGRHSTAAKSPTGPVRLTSVAELRAGTPRRPYRGALAAATEKCLGGSEVRPACRRAVRFSCASERPARQLEREVRRPRAHDADSVTRC
jgi:hypothetical protein